MVHTKMRFVSAAEAVAGIRSRQQVFVHGGAATPSLLLSALAARGPELEEVGVVHMHCEGAAPHLAPELAGHLRHRALFIGPNARQAVNDGRAEYIPVFLSDIPQLFARRQVPLDVALVNVSAPDPHGFCSLGTSVDVTLAAIRAADVVVAQVNRAMPRTLGDGIIHVGDIDFAVDCAIPPVAVPPVKLGDVERRIGQHVAELVPDGATLQMGIGAIPAAVAGALGDKRDLGVHTEMFTDSVVDLVERGVITGARKQINRGKIVSAFVRATKPAPPRNRCNRRAAGHSWRQGTLGPGLSPLPLLPRLGGA